MDDIGRLGAVIEDHSRVVRMSLLFVIMAKLLAEEAICLNDSIKVVTSVLLKPNAGGTGIVLCWTFSPSDVDKISC